MHENALLAAIRAMFATDDPSVLLGSGPDDCAHVLADGRRLAMTIDAFVEGGHFLSDAGPKQVARKSMGASLSDLAGSACRARWVMVSLCLRKGLDKDWAASFAAELAESARRYEVAVVGGDTVASGHGTFVSIAAIGEPLPGGPILRSGAKPGDVLVVTGELGGTILGKHLEPVPRLREIRLLMEYCGRAGLGYPDASMDLSDGLALDLSRLAAESGVGAVVDAGAVPVSDAARRMARKSEKAALVHALSDGEDFELLLALPPPLWDGFQTYLASPEGRVAADGMAPFTRVGEVTEGREIFIRNENGVLRPLPPKGFEHQW